MDDRLKAALAALNTFKKDYERRHKGSEVTVGLGKDLLEKGFGKITAIPSGILALDILLAGGPERYKTHADRAGWTRKRFCLVEGPTGVGKTSLAYRTIASAQRSGGIAAYVNVENSYDPDWAETNGVDTSTLLGGQFESAEDGFNFIRSVAKSRTIDLLVYDSVVGLSSLLEMESAAGKERDLRDNSVALLPRILSQFFRMSTHEVAKSDTSILFTNQIRVDIGAYGTPERGPGGHALKHYLSNRVSLRRGPKAEWPENGMQIVARIGKSNTGAREGDSLPFLFFSGSGPDDIGTAVDLAVSLGWITQNTEGEKTKRTWSYTDLSGKTWSFPSKNMIRKYVVEYSLADEIVGRITGRDFNPADIVLAPTEETEDE